MSVVSFIIYGLLALGLFYVTDRVSYAWSTFEKQGFNEFLSLLDVTMNQIKENPAWLSLNRADIINGVVVVIFTAMLIFAFSQNRKHFKKGKEHGSARWARKNEINPYMDLKNKQNNIILSKTEGLNMASKLPGNKYVYERNKNVLLEGGTGSGKTFFYVLPNILQMHSSFVTTDPKGQLPRVVGHCLETHGYQIKILNLIELEKSMHYNPFAYIRSEEDVLKLVDNLILNTTDKNKHGGEQFWTDAEKLLYYSVFFFVYYEAPDYEKSIVTVVKMIELASASEEDENAESPLDMLFSDLENRLNMTDTERKDPARIALSFYKDFKKATGKTAKSILISAAARLAPFKIPRVQELLAYDEIAFDDLGEKKSALFILIPDTHATFNFIAAMFYTQMFDTLVHKADTEYNGSLPIHVRCILDEFANTGIIPNFEKLIATIRSREISATIIVQSSAQIKAIYKENTDTIIDNCDSFVFLGGKGAATRKEVSELLGKETVDVRAMNRTYGAHGSTSQSNSIVGSDLMTAEEVAVMDNAYCITSIRGCHPFYSRKYRTPKHPNYKFTANYNKNYAWSYRPDSSTSAKDNFFADIEKVLQFTEEGGITNDV